MSAAQAHQAGDDLPGRIAALAGPLAEVEQVELLDVEVKGQRGNRIVRLTADADGGLDIDRIAALSRSVGDAIDDLIEGAYTLEVTSPGADRPLRTARDFARNVGRDVRVQRTAGSDGPGEVVGKLVDASDESITLNVKGRSTTVALEEIDHGKVVLPW